MATANRLQYMFRSIGSYEPDHLDLVHSHSTSGSFDPQALTSLTPGRLYPNATSFRFDPQALTSLTNN